jgi:phospholipase C
MRHSARSPSNYSSCRAPKGGFGDGDFTDLQGKLAMGYYDQDILNYSYYMAAQFAISDRWFSPISSKAPRTVSRP